MEEDMSHASAPVAMSGCRKLGALPAEDMVVTGQSLHQAWPHTQLP